MFCKLEETISINSNKISNKIDYFLEKYLKRKVGNKCIKEGYVYEKSIKILSKSLGKINAGHLSNNIYYDIVYIADIFNPGIGTIIPNCIIVKKTKMGLIANGNNNYSETRGYPITILIAAQHNADNKKFKKYKEKDIVKIELVGKKYEQNNKYIYGIGKIYEEESNDNNIGVDIEDINEDSEDDDDDSDDDEDGDDEENEDGDDEENEDGDEDKNDDESEEDINEEENEDGDDKNDDDETDGEENEDGKNDDDESDKE